METGEDDEDDNDNQQKEKTPGYGFVCFEKCEDARKALEHFHEKGDESSVSIDLHSSSKGGDDASLNL